MGPWGPQAMIHMGPTAPGKGPIIDAFIQGKFKIRPQDDERKQRRWG